MSAPVTVAVEDDRSAFGRTDWSLFLALSLVWGASFLFIKIGLEAFHPGVVTWVRVSLGAIALRLLPRNRLQLRGEDRRSVLWLSIIWVAVPFTLFPLAEEHVSSAVAGMLNGATPIFTGLIAGLFFNRRPRGPQLLGIGIGFVGVSLVSLGASSESPSALLGVMMGLGAAFFYGIATNMAGPLQRKYGSVPVMRQMLEWGALMTTPFGLWGLRDSSFSWEATGAVTVLGIFGTGYAFALMATLVGRVGGPRASFLTYVTTVVSMALGAIILDEPIQQLAIIGVALVILGAFLASRREH